MLSCFDIVYIYIYIEREREREREKGHHDGGEAWIDGEEYLLEQ
jgi:hypothetical protein